MPHLLAVIVPLGLAAAVSPMMFAEQTVLIAAPGGRRAGFWYAAGTALVLLLLCALVALFGRSVALPRAPHLDASLDVALGGMLLLLAWLAAREGRGQGRRPTQPRHRGAAPMGSIQALSFGVFSMGTNATTLPVVLVAAKDISASGSPAIEQLLAVVVLVGLATFPAWAPLAATILPGGTGDRTLSAVGRFVDHHGRAAVVGILAVVGGFLIVRGVLRLAGVLG